jgi:hypothetical protein
LSIHPGGNKRNVLNMSGLSRQHRARALVFAYFGDRNGLVCVPAEVIV